MIKTLPTIVSAFKDSIGDFKAGSAGKSTLRTEKDLPLVFVLVGAVVLVAFMAIIPSIPTNFLSAMMIVVFGFFFVTVSSRIVGIIGSSSNPISGMTIATLMATSLIFVGLGWTGSAHQPIALVVGSIVCIAANAGATSRDLKTGYIVGATPIKQQYGLIIGVVASSVVIGATMLILNNAIGIGADSTVSANPLPAPQATLMATVIKGLLSQDLPGGLVVTGMGISAVLELAGVRSLPFAVGAYLPLSTTAPIFLGGLVKWFVEKKNSSKEDDGEGWTGSIIQFGSCSRWFTYRNSSCCLNCNRSWKR
ncbi:MAG: OPT/YSL family transporter [Ignavibacteriales bacterium]|nr:OPT/YSL family transporter [Ignavibacteriales bacterium]